MLRFLTFMVSLFMLPSLAYSVPVTFTFSTTVGSSAISGVSASDVITVQVIADNGSASLVSQTWLATDVLSATASAGTYQATYITPFYDFRDSFTTDASGLLSSVGFGDVDNNNQDIFGTGGMVALGSDALRDFYGNLAFFSGCAVPPGTGPNCSTDISLWSVTIAPVPLPPSLLLLGSGLLGLVWGRRKHPVSRVA